MSDKLQGGNWYARTTEEQDYRWWQQLGSDERTQLLDTIGAQKGDREIRSEAADVIKARIFRGLEPSLVQISMMRKWSLALRRKSTGQIEKLRVDPTQEKDE